MMRYEMDGADCVDTMRPEDLHNFFTKMGNGSVVHTSAVNVGDEIVVKSSQKVTRLVRLKDISFFEILNKKFIEKMR